MPKNSSPVTLAREELYGLVWKTPIEVLAKEYRISGRGLSKICQRHGIPVPPRGYWTRLKAGRAVIKQKTLAEKPEGSSDITIYPTLPKVEEPEPKLGPEAQKQVNSVLAPEYEIPIPKTLHSCHRVIGAWENEERERIKRWGRSNIHGQDDNPLLRKRRLLFLTALFKEVERLGHSIKIDNGLIWSPNIVIYNETLEFSCDEYHRQRRVPLTEEQLRDPFNVSRGSTWTQVKEPTGKLQFRIKSYFYSDKNTKWIDQPDLPLEQQLKSIIVGLLTTAEIKRQASIARAKNEVEERRKIMEQEKQRALRANEKARWRHLVHLAEHWETARKVRSFLDQIEQRLEEDRKSGKEFPGYDKAQDWIKWAHEALRSREPFTYEIEGLINQNLSIKATNYGREVAENLFEVDD